MLLVRFLVYGCYKNIKTMLFISQFHYHRSLALLDRTFGPVSFSRIEDTTKTVVIKVFISILSSMVILVSSP